MIGVRKRTSKCGCVVREAQAQARLADDDDEEEEAADSSSSFPSSFSSSSSSSPAGEEPAATEPPSARTSRLLQGMSRSRLLLLQGPQQAPAVGFVAILQRPSPRVKQKRESGQGERWIDRRKAGGEKSGKESTFLYVSSSCYSLF